MILASDIGGTKTKLAVCEPDATTGGVASACASCARPSSRPAPLARGDPRQVPRRPGAAPAAACFGVAGPVEAGTAGITRPAVDDRGAAPCRRGSACAPVALLNDLQATALARSRCPRRRSQPLGARRAALPARDDRRHRARHRARRGGAGLRRRPRYARCRPRAATPTSRPTTDEEIELLRFMRARHGRPSASSACCPARGRRPLRLRARPARQGHRAGARGARRGRPQRGHLGRGARRGDPDCVHALALFVALLGAEAGNHALPRWRSAAS